MRVALGILLVSLLVSCSPQASDKAKKADAAARPMDDACTVAVRFVEGWLRDRHSDRPVVFSDAADTTPNNPAPGPWFKFTGEYGSAPAPELLAKGPEMVRDSAVARCPVLRAYLDRAHISHGAKAVAGIVAGASGADVYRADVLGISLPSLSPDGSQALAITSIQSGPLSGLGQFFLLERQDDGGWTAISTQRLWIS